MRYLFLLIRVTGKHLKSFCCALSERLIAKWHLNRSQLYDSASKAGGVTHENMYGPERAGTLLMLQQELNRMPLVRCPQKIPSLMAVADRFTWRYRSKPRWIFDCVLNRQHICFGQRANMCFETGIRRHNLLYNRFAALTPTVTTASLGYTRSVLLVRGKRLLERGSCLLRHCSRSLPDMSCGFHCQQQDQIQSTTSHLCRHCSVIFLTLYCLTHVIKSYFLQFGHDI